LSAARRRYSIGTQSRALVACLRSGRAEHGLHQRDNDRLLHTLKGCVIGQQVLVVEQMRIRLPCGLHFGLGRARFHGGELVAAGNCRKFWNKKSLTELYGRWRISIQRFHVSDFLLAEFRQCAQRPIRGESAPAPSPNIRMAIVSHACSTTKTVPKYAGLSL